MGKILDEFERKKRIYLAKKRQHSKKSEYERVLKIRKFIKYCEDKGVKRIKDITEKEYRGFVADVLSDKSTETKRKYLYALREFFTRAHLNIRINTQKAIQRTKEKKMNKILKILSIENITEEQKEQLLKII